MISISRAPPAKFSLLQQKFSRRQAKFSPQSGNSLSPVQGLICLQNSLRSKAAHELEYLFSAKIERIPSPTEGRISSPLAAGISSCPLGRISSAKRISFPDFTIITQPANIGKQNHLFSAKIERISLLGCERISAALREFRLTARYYNPAQLRCARISFTS